MAHVLDKRPDQPNLEVLGDDRVFGLRFCPCLTKPEKFEFTLLTEPSDARPDAHDTAIKNHEALTKLFDAAGILLIDAGSGAIKLAHPEEDAPLAMALLDWPEEMQSAVLTKMRKRVLLGKVAGLDAICDHPAPH